MSFELNNVLAKDCFVLGDFKLCRLLLMNDKQYPWFILVPRKMNVLEICELERDDLISYQIESNLVSRMIKSLFQPDKLNIASLGNVVSQLHIHHIGRFKDDAAWPAPVWGAKTPQPYTEAEFEEVKSKVAEQLGNNLKKISLS